MKNETGEYRRESQSVILTNQLLVWEEEGEGFTGRNGRGELAWQGSSCFLFASCFDVFIFSFPCSPLLVRASFCATPLY